jgi:predicted transcriptional regulator
MGVVFKRASILRLVCEERPEKRELVASVPKSRPTVDRAIRELEDFNLVRRENGVCKPTYTGKMACTLFSDLEHSFATLEDVKDELSSLPRDADLDEGIFHGASVFQPPDHAPYEKIEPMYEDFSECTKLVGMTRVVLPPYISRVLESGARGAADIDLIITDQVLEVLLENDHDLIMECIETGDSIYTLEGLSKYSLFLIDSETLYIAVYSESNHLSTVLRNTEHQAVEWARNKISSLKNDASLLTA